MLLKYSLSDIKIVKDPVLLAMAEGMWFMLSQKWLFGTVGRVYLRSEIMSSWDELNDTQR